MRFTEAERSKMTRGRPNVPYFLCLQRFWMESAHCADSLPDGEQVFYISDNLDGGFKDNAEDAFKAFKDDRAWKQQETRRPSVQAKRKIPASCRFIGI